MAKPDPGAASPDDPVAPPRVARRNALTREIDRLTVELHNRLVRDSTGQS